MRTRSVSGFVQFTTLRRTAVLLWLAGWLAVDVGGGSAAAQEPSWDAGSALSMPRGLDAGVDGGSFVAPSQGIEAPEPPLGVVEVTVRAQSLEQRMEQSAESVFVTNLSEARRQSADLGEVLARTAGVGIRRTGGLGSDTRIVLGGFEGDQVRVLLDGLPIEFAGFGMGISNLPLSLLERVEVYRGSVPARFGANALGGAINVVTRQPGRGAGGYGSLQLGSFGTVRAAAGAHHMHAPSGLLTRVNTFYDAAKNDYPVRVEVGNASGGSSALDVYRKHDAYRAGGAGVDVGFVRRPWAERLMLRTFVSGRSNQFQSDLAMAKPYGEVHYGGENYGLSLEYEQTLLDALKFEALAGYGLQKFRFIDTSPYRYDWFGQRTLEKPGELGLEAMNQHFTEHGTFARVQTAWEVDRWQTLRLVIAPTYTTRTGYDRETKPNALDSLAADRRLLTFINALEHNLKLFSDRLENTLFGKSYFYRVTAEEPLSQNNWRSLDRNAHRFGVGDGVSVHVTDFLFLKAAYEFATRLPRADEVFGDGGRIGSNLSLKPEHSHNTNVSAVLRAKHEPVGAYGLEAHYFDRRARDLITVLGRSDFATYQNIANAHARGVELMGHWASPGDYLAIDGNMTYIAMRNESKDGDYAAFSGDRIPNRPYMFANGAARLAFARVMHADDQLQFGYNLRYVHWFWRAWESGGTAGPKQRIPSQISHALSLTYLFKVGPKSYSFSMDVQNLGDARLYDNFGTQRPGRAYSSKVGADF